MTALDHRRGTSRLGLWADRDFRLLWTGESVSSVGSAVSSVALPLVAITVVHAAPFTIGVLTAAAWLPWLVVGLPAGVWVDRLPRRAVMITADVVSALALMSLPVAAWVGALTSVHLVAVALVTGTAKVFFASAYRAYLPCVVEADDLVEGNAKLQGSEQVANVAGPGLAGVVAQLAGAVGGVVVDAATFVVSAVCLRRIDRREPPCEPHRRALREEVGGGLRIAWRDPLLRANMVFGCASNFGLTGYQSLLVVFLVRDVGLSAGVTGLLVGVTSVGGLLGAVVARSAAGRLGEARAVLVGKCVLAPAGLLIAATTSGPGLLLFLGGSILLVGGIVAGNVIWGGFVQRYVPGSMMGRVTAGSQVVNFGAIPLGALCAGALATVVDVRTAVAVMLGVVVASGAILLAGPLRGMRDLPTRPLDCGRTEPVAVAGRMDRIHSRG